MNTQTIIALYKRFRNAILLLPVGCGLCILLLGADSVPNVPTLVIACVISLALMGYTGFIFARSYLSLRLGTTSLLTLGIVRSSGYLFDRIWVPAGVWLIAAGLTFLAHGYLRQSEEI